MKLETWAAPILKKYKALLLLQDHTLSFSYDKKMRSDTVMEHGFHYPYKSTDISYGDTAKKLWKEGKKKELREVLIHELCHSITDPLFSVGFDRFTSKDTLNNERERVTDHIANIIIALNE